MAAVPRGAAPRSRSCATAAGGSAILSNSDRDLIEASKQLLGVPFDETVVASEIGSYKPAHKHWREFEDLACADPARYVHVAQSHFHDIVPATELGIPNVWINRLGERREPAPTRELPDLTRPAGRARRARSRGVTAGRAGAGVQPAAPETGLRSGRLCPRA